MIEPMPIRLLDPNDFEFWLYTAKGGERMKGPEVLNQYGHRIGQLVLMEKVARATGAVDD